MNVVYSGLSAEEGSAVHGPNSSPVCLCLQMRLRILQVIHKFSILLIYLSVYPVIYILIHQFKNTFPLRIDWLFVSLSGGKKIRGRENQVHRFPLKMYTRKIWSEEISQKDVQKLFILRISISQENFTY